MSCNYCVCGVCVCVCVWLGGFHTCAVVGARSVHGGFRRVIDNTPHPLPVLLVVDHLGACADVPDTDRPLVVTGGQMILVIRIEEHTAEKVQSNSETGKKFLAEKKEPHLSLAWHVISLMGKCLWNPVLFLSVLKLYIWREGEEIREWETMCRCKFVGRDAKKKQTFHRQWAYWVSHTSCSIFCHQVSMASQVSMCSLYTAPYPHPNPLLLPTPFLGLLW